MELGYIVSIIFSILLSSLVGIEREHNHKPAGFRTCICVCLSMTIFMLINLILIERFPGKIDPSRIISYTIAGIGFLGSGLIIHSGKHVEGMTTASLLFILVTIGLLCGLSEFSLASFITVVILFILKIKKFEKVIKRKR